MPFVRILLSSLFLLSIYNSNAQNSAIDSLQKIIGEQKSDLKTIHALNSIASENMRLDMEKAKAYLHRSIDLAQKLKHDIALCNAYSQMVTLQMNIGKRDSAQYYFQLLRKLITEDSPEVMKGNFNLTAGLYYKKIGNFKEALPFMIQSLNDNIAADKKNQTVDNKTSVAGQYLNIGNIYSDLGNYKEAIKNHLQGLNIFEELSNKKGISFCTQSIGADLFYLGRYKEAIPYISKSIELKRELNDKRGIAIANSRFGEIYKGLGEYDKSVTYFNNAIKSYLELKLVPDEAKAAMEVGKVYILKKDNQTAYSYFETAKALALQIKDSTLLISIDAAMAALQNSNVLQLNKEEKLKNSLKNSIAMGDKNNELLNYQYLVDFYTRSKQFDKALEYATKRQQATDSISNEKLELQIKQMEQQYNFEKKKREILLLKKDQELSALSLARQRAVNMGIVAIALVVLISSVLAVNRNRALNQTKRQLELEKMRNSLAQDLHDDIGSALSSISIMSQMPSPLHTLRIREQAAQIQERMADIVWTINPMNDSLEKMVMRMKEFAAEILEPKNINYLFEGEESLSGILISIEKRKNIFLIFKEALNNAAKYSEATTLKIIFSIEKEYLKLIVADNGKGFIVLQAKDGNGLKNMSERAKAIQGVLYLTSDLERGTTVDLQVAIT